MRIKGISLVIGKAGLLLAFPQFSSSITIALRSRRSFFIIASLSDSSMDFLADSKICLMLSRRPTCCVVSRGMSSSVKDIFLQRPLAGSSSTERVFSIRTMSSLLAQVSSMPVWTSCAAEGMRTAVSPSALALTIFALFFDELPGLPSNFSSFFSKPQRASLWLRAMVRQAHGAEGGVCT